MTRCLGNLWLNRSRRRGLNWMELCMQPHSWASKKESAWLAKHVLALTITLFNAHSPSGNRCIGPPRLQGGNDRGAGAQTGAYAMPGTMENAPEVTHANTNMASVLSVGVTTGPCSAQCTRKSDYYMRIASTYDWDWKIDWCLPTYYNNYYHLFDYVVLALLINNQNISGYI